MGEGYRRVLDPRESSSFAMLKASWLDSVEKMFTLYAARDSVRIQRRPRSRKASKALQRIEQEIEYRAKKTAELEEAIVERLKAKNSYLNYQLHYSA